MDGAGLNYPLHQHLAALVSPPEQVALFEGTPEGGVAESDPTLLRLNLAHAEQQTWSEELLQTAHDEHRVLVLLSEWQLEALGKHLRRFTQAGLNDGRTTGLLSYYNPYVFQGLAQNLDAQQCYQFHAALLSWHWIDRDGDRSGFLAFPNPATWP